ncbi:MAG: hypothetical protein WB558_17955 [Terriglobales bacterium]
MLFVGLPEIPEPEYGGTAFIVTWPGRNHNDFAFMVTARHVAEKLEGRDFYIRANTKKGKAVDLHGLPDNPWWYHPTEKEHVDAAVTMFSPARLSELDVEHIPIAMFADHATIELKHLGVGDEVFIVGLFTKVTETTKNIPIVRSGTVAMIPGERIPFADIMMDAYLVEARSIGGLSGSPVFVRETLMIPASGSYTSSEGTLPAKWLHGLGQIYFLGSMIGHWDVPKGFSPTQAEAVNMGVAPIVPAHKIREIILQPELVDLMKKIDDEMSAKNQKGAAVDFAESESKPLTQDDFEATLKKASRRVDTAKKT